MAWDRIVLDPEEAAATIEAWRRYADVLERHSADPSSLAESQRSLGEFDSACHDENTIEFRAPQGAYELLAQRARQHADRLEQTAQAFANSHQAAVGYSAPIGGQSAQP